VSGGEGGGAGAEGVKSGSDSSSGTTAGSRRERLRRLDALTLPGTVGSALVSREDASRPVLPPGTRLATGDRWIR
jgi:hypothetical protein